MKPSKFRKKPVVIEAIRYDGTPESKNELWEFVHPFVFTEPADPENQTKIDRDIFISTLEGHMKVSPGDWVIKGVKGEFYPCKPDIFAATYEPVEEDEANQKARTPAQAVERAANTLLGIARALRAPESPQPNTAKHEEALASAMASLADEAISFYKAKVEAWIADNDVGKLIAGDVAEGCREYLFEFLDAVNQVYALRDRVNDLELALRQPANKTSEGEEPAPAPDPLVAEIDRLTLLNQKFKLMEDNARIEDNLAWRNSQRGPTVIKAENGAPAKD